MAKRKATEPEPVETAESDPVGVINPILRVPDEPEPSEHHDPDTEYGVEDSSGNVVYTTYKRGNVRARQMLVRGVNLEHIRDDDDECWIYRAM